MQILRILRAFGLLVLAGLALAAIELFPNSAVWGGSAAIATYLLLVLTIDAFVGAFGVKDPARRVFVRAIAVCLLALFVVPGLILLILMSKESGDAWFFAVAVTLLVVLGVTTWHARILFRTKEGRYGLAAAGVFFAAIVVSLLSLGLDDAVRLVAQVVLAYLLVVFAIDLFLRSLGLDGSWLSGPRARARAIILVIVDVLVLPWLALGAAFSRNTAPATSIACLAAIGVILVMTAINFNAFARK